MVYIGARDRERRIEAAAKEVRDMQERSGITEEEAITKVAKQQGVKPGEVKERKKELEKPSQSYGYSPGKSQTSNIVPTRSGKHVPVSSLPPVQRAQAEKALRKYGKVTKITEDKKKGTVSYHGPGGRKITYPKSGTSFAPPKNEVRPTTREEFVRSITQKQITGELFRKQYERTKSIPFEKLAPSQKAIVRSREQVYVTGGRIPERGVEVKRYFELDRDERGTIIPRPTTQQYLIRELEKDLNKQKLKGVVDGPGNTRSASKNNVLVYSDNGNLRGKDTSKEQALTRRYRAIGTQEASPKDFFVELGKIAATPVKGVGKVLYMPNYTGRKPIIDVGQHKVLSSKSLIKDPDVQTAAVVGGLLALPPVLAAVAGTTIAAPVVVQSLKSPSPEGLANLVALGAGVGILKGSVKPKRTFTTKIGETVTTFIKAPFNFGWKSKSGKRAVIFTDPKPSGMSSITGYSVKKTSKRTPSVGAFAKELPLYEGPQVLKVRKREQNRRAYEQLAVEMRTREFAPVIQTPSKLRREFRKGIKPEPAKGIFADKIEIKKPINVVERIPSTKLLRKQKRRQIVKTIDVSPKGIFAKEVPIYQPPSYYKVKAKESKVRAKEQLLTDIEKGIIPIGQVRPSIRREARKTISRRVKGQISMARARGKKVPKELYFDIKRLPIPYWKIEKKVTPIKSMVAKPPAQKKKPQFIEKETKTGQILLMKPPKTKKAKVQMVSAKTQASVAAQVSVQAQRYKMAAPASKFDKYLGTKQRKESITERLTSTKASRRLRSLFLQTSEASQKLAISGSTSTYLSQASATSQSQIQSVSVLSAQKSAQAQRSILAQARPQMRNQMKGVQQTITQQKQLLRQKAVSSKSKLTRKVRHKPKVELLKNRLNQRKVKGYYAYVKRRQAKRGKGSYQSRGYEKVNEKPLPKKEALGKLGETLDQFSNRSGYIKEAKKRIQKKLALQNRWSAIQHKFRRSKDRKRLVEKSQFAIDSVSEKNEIPYEAARLRKLNLLKTKSRLINAKKKRRKQIGWL